jgi:serine protease Do
MTESKGTKNNNNKKILFSYPISFEALLMFITLISIMQIIPIVVLAQAQVSSSPSEVAEANDTDSHNSSNDASAIILNDRNNNNNNTISDQPLSYNLSRLFEKVEGSVVQVSNKILSPPATMNANHNNSDSLFGSTLGSGFVYDNNGHIVTNYHVVTGGVIPTVGDNIGNNTGEVQVTFQDGTIYDATVVGIDAYSDLAVLKLTGDIPKDKLVPLPVGSSSGLKVGERVAAIGNPFGLSGTMTEGIISGLGRQLPVDISTELEQQEQQQQQPQQQRQQPPLLTQNIPSYFIANIIQTDAAMNPGNSGGPLLDMRGEVIGVNIAIFSATGAYSGVGLAIPSDAVSRIVPSLISTGTYHHPYIGIAGVDISPSIAELIGLKEARGGFLITEITAGSPAAKASLRGGYVPTNVDGMIIDMGGDVILTVDNKTVRTIEDLTSYIESKKDVGDTLTLRVLRDGRLDDIDLTLATRPGLETIVQNVSLTLEQNQEHSHS